jgi:hypothetical protein
MTEMSTFEIRSLIHQALGELYELDGELADEWEGELYYDDASLILENWTAETLQQIQSSVRSATPILHSYTEITPND